MNTHTITIPVDFTNPGQFFACCGMLELAYRLDADAVGNFNERAFTLRSGVDFHSLKHVLVATECESLAPDDLYTPVLHIAGSVNLRLDWWQDSRAGGKSLKTWAGQQRVQVIFDLMRRAVEGVERSDELMDYADAVREVSDGKAKSKTASPFYFDARRSATALDIGFSPDVQNMSAVSFPAVESLGLIGLQRFRPLQGKSRTFKYFAWRTPLPASVAAPAAAIGFAGGNCYSFATASRGGDYLKMFTPSKLERSTHEQV